jgi:hypothetical protein
MDKEYATEFCGLETIAETLKVNKTLTREFCGEMNSLHSPRGSNLMRWYAMCNKVCDELGAGIKLRNSIPRRLKYEQQISLFVKNVMGAQIANILLLYFFSIIIFLFFI